jgi:hypothetical protein
VWDTTGDMCKWYLHVFLCIHRFSLSVFLVGVYPLGVVLCVSLGLFTVLLALSVVWQYRCSITSLTTGTILLVTVEFCSVISS